MPSNSNLSFFAEIAIGAAIIAGAIYGISKWQTNSRLDAAVQLQVNPDFSGGEARHYWGKGGYLLANQIGEGETQFISGMLDEAGARSHILFVEKDEDMPVAFILGQDFQKERRFEISAIEEIAEIVAARHVDISDTIYDLVRTYEDKGKGRNKEPGRLIVGHLFMLEVIDALQPEFIHPSLSAGLEVIRIEDFWGERTLADVDKEDVQKVRELVRNVAIEDPILRAQILEVVAGRAPLTEKIVREEALGDLKVHPQSEHREELLKVIDPFASLAPQRQELAQDMGDKLGF